MNTGNRSRRAVLLDRDGVLVRTFERNGIPHPPADVSEIEILPGVPASLLSLKRMGFALLVVTNQPDVARGTQTRDRVEQINAMLCRWLPLDGVYTCFHDSPDRCSCRKPAPGLLLRAAAEHGLDPRLGFMIGDRWSDIAAGQAAGCRSILIHRTYSDAGRCSPDGQVADLTEAAEWVARFADRQKVPLAI